jgi:hypothetical protein
MATLERKLLYSKLLTTKKEKARIQGYYAYNANLRT